MSDNEWIELILLRSCGDTSDPLLERFDREAIAAVRFEMKGGEQQEDLERSVSRRNRDFS